MHKNPQILIPKFQTETHVWLNSALKQHQERSKESPAHSKSSHLHNTHLKNIPIPTGLPKTPSHPTVHTRKLPPHGPSVHFTGPTIIPFKFKTPKMPTLSLSVGLVRRDEPLSLSLCPRSILFYGVSFLSLAVSHFLPLSHFNSPNTRNLHETNKYINI